MGQVNWIAVVLAGLVAAAVAFPWYRLWRLRAPHPARLVAMLLPAVLMGHNFARLDPAHLAAKPHLYWMMTGGFALFIVLPAGFALYGRHGLRGRDAAVDAGYVLAAFMAMGTVFWALR